MEERGLIVGGAVGGGEAAVVVDGGGEVQRWLAMLARAADPRGAPAGRGGSGGAVAGQRRGGASAQHGWQRGGWRPILELVCRGVKAQAVGPRHGELHYRGG